VNNQYTGDNHKLTAEGVLGYNEKPKILNVCSTEKLNSKRCKLYDKQYSYIDVKYR